MAAHCCTSLKALPGLSILFKPTLLIIQTFSLINYFKLDGNRLKEIIEDALLKTQLKMSRPHCLFSYYYCIPLVGLAEFPKSQLRFRILAHLTWNSGQNFILIYYLGRGFVILTYLGIEFGTQFYHNLLFEQGFKTFENPSQNLECLEIWVFKNIWQVNLMNN